MESILNVSFNQLKENIVAEFKNAVIGRCIDQGCGISLPHLPNRYRLILKGEIVRNLLRDCNLCQNCEITGKACDCLILFERNGKNFVAIVELEKTATDDYFKSQLENGLKLIRCIAKNCGYNINFRRDLKNLQNVFLLFLYRHSRRKGTFYVEINLHGETYNVIPGRCNESIFEILRRNGINI